MTFTIENIITRFKGNSRSAIVKKNILASLFIKGWSILISLLLVPLTLGYVSSEMYGIWLTLSSIVLWMNFFDVGFTLGLKNKLAEALANQDYIRGKSLVSTTYFMMLVIFIPLCIMLELFIPFISWNKLLNFSHIYETEVVIALRILIACFCIQMIVNVLVATVAAFQKVALSSLFSVIGNTFSLIIILILRQTTDGSLVLLAIALAITPIIVVIIASIILYSKSLRNISPYYKYVKFEYIKDLFSLGSKFFLIQIQAVVFFQTTNVLISNVSDPTYVTSYNIAYKYFSVALMLYTIILTPLWPAFTNAYVKNDFAWMRKIYKKLVIIYFCSALLVIFMMLISSFIYQVWVGKDVVIPSMMTFCVAIYILINSWDSLQVNLINGIGKIQLQTYVTLLGLILHIPLALFLSNFYGAYGVLFSKIAITFIYAIMFTYQIKLILNKHDFGIFSK